MPFEAGFDYDEARQCLALSANVETNTPTTSTEEEAKGSLKSNIGAGSTQKSWVPCVPDINDWEIVVNPTESIGLDNYWRLYRSRSNPVRYAAATRGTVATAKSVLADLLVEVINAKGAVQIRESDGIPGYKFDFTLAEAPYAGVHLGFTYSLGALINPNWDYALRKHMQTAVDQGAKEFFITGHSQGAAMATLLRSYLHYQPLGDDISYKTYVFAQPKPGNDYLANDFDQLFGTPGMAYRLTNSLDWVPQVPLTLELLSDMNTPNPISAIPRLLIKFLERSFACITRFLFNRGDSHSILKASVAEEHRFTLGRDLLTLNYSAAANPIALAGDPAIGEEHPGDMFAQHHLGVYWELMQKILKPDG